MHQEIVKTAFVQLAAAALLVGVLTSLSCGELPDGDTGSGGEGGETVERGAYPSCYGVEEGELLENLEFARPDGTPFVLNEFYQDTSNKALLVSTSAGWCGACIEEQPALQAMYEKYRDQGLEVMVSLFEDSQFNAATPELAAEWQDRFDLTLTVVADSEFLFEDYYDASLTPMNMIVDLSTMTIVYIETGWDESQVEATIQSLL